MYYETAFLCKMAMGCAIEYLIADKRQQRYIRKLNDKLKQNDPKNQNDN